MEKVEQKALKDRWSDQHSAAALGALSGRGRGPFPPMSDGRADLRGLVIREFIKNATIHSIDLSSALFEGFGQLGSCTVEQTLFRHASLKSNLGSKFSACDFTSADLTRAVLRGEFSDCDFSSANLTSVMGSEVRFVRCVFFKTNFGKATLTHCTFEDCRFEECRFRSGSFAYSSFVRSPIPQVDLGNFLMEKVVWS